MKTLVDQMVAMEERVEGLKFLKPGWGGKTFKAVNAKTRKLAIELIESGFFKEEWRVGLLEDGSILFTKKRGYRNIMVAAL